LRVFISHQASDSELAARIAHHLEALHEIKSYLDVIDPYAGQAGDQLGEYIREQLGVCTQLLAVVSKKTQSSWWVPWEIGIATEKDQPIATFASDEASLPEYLRLWPYLRSREDLDSYAIASKEAARTTTLRKAYISESAAQRSGTQTFYRSLRARLRQ
jgi:TIR domain